MNLGRLFRTIRYLKPAQTWGRVARVVDFSRPNLGSVPPLRAPVAPWIRPIARSASLRGRGSIRLLNVDADITGPKIWNDRAYSALWLYNLHYFDDMTSPAAIEEPEPRLRLLMRWLAENAPGQGVGWDPYPTSLRIVNWIKSQLGGFPLPLPAIESLAVQARWLADHIETHLLGNHLLANAKALVFAGGWFGGGEAIRWLHLGLDLYDSQLPEQVLNDGGHFERSPMYHALILEDLLDVINVSRTFGFQTEPAIERLSSKIGQMRKWLLAMTHPDGRIAFFNDAAFGIAPDLANLEAYSARLRLPAIAGALPPIVDLSDSGYLRVNSGSSVIIIDAAPIGPDYLPGHAHADTLSFELSLAAERVIVNGGTSVYGNGPDRQAERATAAHSTVEIDRQDSSEVWSGFRVGRRARVIEVTKQLMGDRVTVEASHDGYKWRPGHPVHRRRWSLNGNGLVLTDTIVGPVSEAIARFHLGPGVTPIVGGDGLTGYLVLPTGRRVVWGTSSAAQLLLDEWRPEFGMRIPSFQLAIEMGGQTLETQFSW